MLTRCLRGGFLGESAAASAVPCGWGREAGEQPEEAAALRSPPPGWLLTPRARRGSGEPGPLPRSPLQSGCWPTTASPRGLSAFPYLGSFLLKLRQILLSISVCCLTLVELTPVSGCPSVILQSTLRNTAMEITGCAWSPAPRSCPLRATSSYSITPTSE